MFPEGRDGLKAALFHNPGEIEVIQRDTPKLKDDEVLLKIDYAGVCGTDKKIYSGDIQCGPVILGHEFSGEAREVGSKVENVKIGNYYNVQPNLSCGVCGVCRKGRYSLCKDKFSYGTHRDGGFAEYCAVDSKLLFPVHNIEHIESALVEPVACCLRGLTMSDLKRGKDVLIIGGGFTGLIFVQLAKLRGANVHLVTRSEKKRALAKSLGADAVNASVNEVNTDFDLVIEAAGKIETVNDAFQAVGRGGSILLFGVTHAAESVSLRPYEVWEKELRIIGSRSNGHNHTDVLKILPELNIRDLISHVVELDDLERGLNLIGQSECVKVIVHMPGGD